MSFTKLTIFRENKKWYPKQHSCFGIKMSWFLSKSTHHPSPSSFWTFQAFPKLTCLFYLFFSELAHYFSAWPHVSELPASPLLSHDCMYPPEGLVNAVLVLWNDPGAYLGFCVFNAYGRLIGVKHIRCIISFNSHNNPMGQLLLLLLPPFEDKHRWGSELTKFKPFAQGRTAISKWQRQNLNLAMSDHWAHALNHHPLLISFVEWV